MFVARSCVLSGGGETDSAFAGCLASLALALLALIGMLAAGSKVVLALELLRDSDVDSACFCGVSVFESVGNRCRKSDWPAPAAG